MEMDSTEVDRPGPVEAFTNPYATTAETAAAHARLRIDASVAVLIVGSPLLAVREDFVGFLGFLEVFFRLGIVRIAVRVMLHGQLAVGLLDFFFRGVAIDAENVVKVAFCHE